jgi:hypothetical protein
LKFKQLVFNKPALSIFVSSYIFHDKTFYLIYKIKHYYSGSMNKQGTNNSLMIHVDSATSKNLKSKLVMGMINWTLAWTISNSNIALPIWVSNLHVLDVNMLINWLDYPAASMRCKTLDYYFNPKGLRATMREYHVNLSTRKDELQGVCHKIRTRKQYHAQTIQMLPNR